jgi:type VI secretion system secreted protein Hcp
MAIDVYLQIDGISGESNDHDHSKWIECKGVNWKVLQPKSATASTAGGHTAERTEHKDILISKLSDMATPLLLQNCSSGKTIPKAKLEFMRADADGKRVKYFEVTLTNVLISSVSPAVIPGDIMTEELALKYSMVTWKYTQQQVGGGQGGSTVGGWDLSKNQVAA